MVLSIPCFGAVASDELTLTPVSDVKAEYDDNPQLVPKGTPTYVGNVFNYNADASARLEHHDERLNLLLAPKVQFVRYPSKSFLDQDNQYLDFNGSYLYERVSWTLLGNVTQDSTTISELQTTGLTAGNRRHDGFSGTFGPAVQLSERWVLTAQVSATRTHYADGLNVGLVDYGYDSGDLKLQWQASELTQLFVEASDSRLHTNFDDFSSYNYGFDAGVTRQLSPSWSVTASLGPNFVHSQFTSDTSFSFSAGTHYQGQLLTVDANAAQQVIPSGRGSLTRQQRFNLYANRPLSERFAVSFSGLLVRNRDITEAPINPNDIIIAFIPNGQPVVLPSIPVFDTRYFNFEGDLKYAVTQHWALSTFIRYERQDIEFVGAAGSQGYRAGLQLSWSPKPYYLLRP